jgi:ubiquinone/menaquinone biosynthesis C-methylase UbiE
VHGHRSRAGATHLHVGRVHDLFAVAFFFGRRGRVYRQLAVLSGARAGDRVLDVGCGDGYLTRIMAVAVGPGGAAHGVDPSSEAIDRARRITHVPNCSYAEGMAQALDAPEASYDVVVTSLMIHHLPASGPAEAIAEMSRVLRPGGRLLIAEFRPPTSPVLRRLIRAFVSPAMQHNPIHELEPMVRDTGFEQVDRGDLHPWIHYVRGLKPPGDPPCREDAVQITAIE